MKRTPHLLNWSACSVLALLLSPAAHAHHAEFMADKPFLQGLSMPVHGLDHLLSAFAVGLVASQTGPRTRWRLAALFALVTLAGGFLNLGGLDLPELSVPLVTAVAGLLLLRGTAGFGAGALVVAAAALCNGQALLQPATNSVIGASVFAVGCLSAAFAVCALGFLAGRAQAPARTRLAGAAVLAGALLLAAFPNVNGALIQLIEGAR